ncbi:MAG: DoxX family protein [Gammaproteobacteria bacterium]
MNTSTTEYGTALLRLAWGVMFIAHGLLKPMVFTMAGSVQFFETVGFPGWLAYVVVAAELIAGTLLIVGYRTRVVAAATLPVLLGAAWVHLPNGWVSSAPNGGWEYPVFLAVAVLVQILLGDGALALGHSRVGATTSTRASGVLSS